LQLLITANTEGTNETRPEACACEHLASDIAFGSFWNSHTGFQDSLAAGCCSKDLVDQWYLEAQEGFVALNIRLPAPAQTRTDANACSRLSAKFAGTT